MNTQNSRYRKVNRFRSGLVAIAMIALSFTACQNNSGTSATSPVYPYGVPPGVAPCQGCAGNMGFLTSAMAQSYDLYYMVEIEMGIDFFGDVNMINQLRGPTPYGAPVSYGLPSMPYMGPVAASGTMAVLRPPISCPMMPPGQYTIQTMAPGVWGNDGAGRSFDNLRIMLAGPMQAQAVISGFTTTATPPAFSMNRTYPYRFTATTFQLQGPWGLCDFRLLLQ